MAVPTALQRLVRRAVLTRLKADAALLDLVPLASIDPNGEPSWPFITVETPRATPLKAACVRGATVRFDVHAFAGPKLVDGQETQTGYDHASAIGGAIEAVLADNRIELEDGSTCRINLSDMQMLKDGLPSEWHWFCQLNVRVLAE